MTVTYIVPTVGRPSLLRTLASIETWPGDEILIVGERRQFTDASVIWQKAGVRFVQCPRGNDWGHTERNVATSQAKGQYIAHIDDDDVYAPGTRTLFESAMQAAPGRPTIFRMRFPNGITLWQDQQIRCGNLGTPCFLMPNVPSKLGTWMPFVGGDCAFLESSKWPADEYVWRPEVIALLGHDVGVSA
jgi:hypothetical protein